MGVRAYIETSVIGYYVSRTSRDVQVAAHQAVTAEWWRRVLPTLDACTSPTVRTEISAGEPEEAQRRLVAVAAMTVLPITAQVSALAQEYFAALSIPARAQADAMHLALAVEHGMDFLVTWNCRHIANENVRFLVRRINERRGVDTPFICTPEEMSEMSYG